MADHGPHYEPSGVPLSHAAVRLGISTQTVRRMIDRGALSAFRVGRQIRVTIASLDGAAGESA